MSKYDILGPIDYLSDIENLVSFKRALFEDYSLKHKMRIFLLFMSISPLRNTCVMNSVYVNYRGVRFLSIYLWSNNKIVISSIGPKISDADTYME